PVAALCARAARRSRRRLPYLCGEGRALSACSSGLSLSSWWEKLGAPTFILEFRADVLEVDVRQDQDDDKHDQADRTAVAKLVIPEGRVVHVQARHQCGPAGATLRQDELQGKLLDAGDEAQDPEEFDLPHDVGNINAPYPAQPRAAVEPGGLNDLLRNALQPGQGNQHACPTHEGKAEEHHGIEGRMVIAQPGVAPLRMAHPLQNAIQEAHVGIVDELPEENTHDARQDDGHDKGHAPEIGEAFALEIKDQLGDYYRH